MVDRINHGQDLISSRRFEKIVELSKEGIWTTGADDLTDYINGFGAAILGYTQEEIIGRPVTDFFLPGSVEDREIKSAESKARKEERNEHRFRRKDGSTIWVSISAQPLFDENGTYEGILRVFSDISERKRMEEELRRSQEDLEKNIEERTRELNEKEERIRHLVQYAPAAIYEIDFKGPRFKSVNRVMCEQSGYTREELLGMNPFNLLDPDSQKVFQERIRRTLKGEDIYNSVDYRLHAKDGHEIVVSLNIKPIYEEGVATGALVVGLDVTERRKAEMENAYLANLLESVSDAVISFDETTKIRSWNKAAESIYGFRPEEVYGRPIVEILGTEFVGDKMDLAFAMMRERGSWSGEVVQRRKDGSPLIVFSSVSSVSRTGDRPLFVAVNRDVTDIRNIDDALKSSEAKYRGLFEAMREAVVVEHLIYDDEGHIVDWIYEDVNPAFVKLIGKDRAEDVKWRSGSEVLGRENVPTFLPILEDTLRTGSQTPVQCQCPISGRDLLCSAVIDGDRAIVAFLDITALRSAQKKTEEYASRNEAILSSMGEGLILFDSHGTVSFINTVARQLLGFSDEEVVGRENGELHTDFEVCQVNGEPLSNIHWPSARAIRGETFSNYEVRVRRKAKLIDLITSSNGRPVISNGKQIGGIMTFRDITRRRKMEEELRRSNADLQQFAYAASHDLQEPLRMVSSYLGLLDKKFGNSLDPQGRQYMGFALDGAERMRNLVNDLLAYSRIGTTGKDFDIVDMNQVAGRVMKSLSVSIAECGAEVNIAPLPTVWADRTQMAQLLQNLIGNAIKFHGADPPRVEVSVQQRAVEWVFMVRDNGIGIDPVNHPRLFQMFQRLHTPDEFPGTGIGLALSKKIVERHGGQIWLESELGKGSTFFFTIPKVEL